VACCSAGARYEDFYTVWPNRKDDPISARLDNLQKYVASTTLSEPLPWINSTLLKGDAAEVVARLKEQPGKSPDAKGMLAQLLTDHETLIRHLRDDAEITMDKHEDTGTNDFLIGLMEKHEKMAWMLRAFAG